MARILIVEDNQENRDLLEAMVAGMGNEVIQAPNGVEALKKARQSRPDLVISDILMPEMDGFSLCRSWRQDEGLKSIPFIFYTATYTDPKDEEFALSLGAERFIVKPMEPSEFLAVIREVLEQYRSGALKAPLKPLPKEAAYLKKYSERLIHKLEDKIHALEKANKALKVDVSERWRMERELRGQMHWVEQILETTLDGYILADAKGVLLDVNPAYCAMVGYSREELLNMNIRDLEATLSASEIELKIRQMLEAGRARFVTKHRCKDGRFIELEVSIVITRTSPEPRVAAFVRDITEHRQMEEELVERERRLRKHNEDLARLSTAIEQASENILITDSKGIIQYVNPSFEGTTGYSRREVLGKNPHLLKSGKQDSHFYRAMWEHLVNGRVWHGHFINRRKDGTLYEEEATISPIRDDAGHITNYVAVKRDVTQEVRLERQLREAQKLEALGTLAGGIAHDFNNILMAIMGYTELSLNKAREPELAANLRQVMKAGLRAKDLIEQILAFSRQHEEQRRPIQISSILKEALKLLRATLPSEVEIRHNIRSELGYVLADPTQIHQIVLNLCTNAAHAMEEQGGTMAVELVKESIDTDFSDRYPELRPGTYLRLSVSDTGCGMSPEVMGKIFEPYFTTKEQGKGTGLGLSVVHGIVKSHRGLVTTYSEAGKGATFNIFLPVVETVPIQEAAEGEEPLPTGREHILFVDDEKPLADLGQQMIQGLGYRVTVRTSSLEALELFRTQAERFDLVITDLSLPQMSGDRLAGELLKIRPNIPIIVSTGFSERMTEVKPPGIRGVIMKPMLRRELALKIRQVLDREQE